MVETYLCFDLGTTKVKSGLINSEGKILYLSTRETKSYNTNNIIFQKPDDFFNMVVEEIRNIKISYGSHFRMLDSIICSGQMAGVLSINENWEVIVPWTYSIDYGANQFLTDIDSRFGDEIRELSGGKPFMAAKIKWLKSDLNEDYKKSYKFINLTSYVAGKLCGLKSSDSFIDFSVLAMNGLADVKKGIWNEEICEKLGIEINKLPKILKPFECVGYIDKKKFGTEKDIKILVGTGDQIASFIGAGIINRNDIIDVSGTYTVLGFCTDRFITDTKNKIFSAIYSGIDDIYYQLSVIAVGGYLYSWFGKKFNYKFDKKNYDFPDSEGLYFIPHIGGRLSLLQPYYEGSWIGIKWHHDINSFFISILESVGYEFNYALSHLKELNSLKENDINEIKVIGGGASDSVWNRIKSDILNLKYLAMKKIPYEIMGCFLIARYGNDLKKGYKNLLNNRNISIIEEIYPEISRVNFYNKHKKRYIKIVEDLAKIYHDLSKEQ